jgi:hypothetical protein
MIELVALCPGFFLNGSPIHISFHENKHAVANMPNFAANFNMQWA